MKFVSFCISITFASIQQEIVDQLTPKESTLVAERIIHKLDIAAETIPLFNKIGDYKNIAAMFGKNSKSLLRYSVLRDNTKVMYDELLKNINQVKTLAQQLKAYEETAFQLANDKETHQIEIDNAKEIVSTFAAKVIGEYDELVNQYQKIRTHVIVTTFAIFGSKNYKTKFGTGILKENFIDIFADGFTFSGLKKMVKKSKSFNEKTGGLVPLPKVTFDNEIIWFSAASESYI